MNDVIINWMQQELCDAVNALHDLCTIKLLSLRIQLSAQRAPNYCCMRIYANLYMVHTEMDNVVDIAHAGACE
jgi:hypothetical protein